MSVELELAFAERCLQPCEELAAEDAAEHLDREEEGAARRDPAQVILSKATCSDDAVHMRMMLQPLVPGMEHAEEADLRTEVPRAGRERPAGELRRWRERAGCTGRACSGGQAEPAHAGA